MSKFNATIEFLSSKRAVVELHDLNGAWAGAERIDARSREGLYELGYRAANQRASLKGGRVETYRQVG